MKTSSNSYIPALGYRWLTRFYDPVVRVMTREVLFKEALFRQASLQDGQRILDLGCGTGTLCVLVKHAHRGAEMFGLDADPEALKLARTKLEAAGVGVQLDQSRLDLRCTTAGRRHERMRALFVFCMDNGWLQINPMNGLKKPIAPRAVPTNYFNRWEFKRIVESTYEYDYGGGTDCWFRAGRMRALSLLMRWSGLAIRDAVKLERTALSDSGALFLRRAKTGVPVFVPLPPAVTSLLRALPSVSPNHFFWRGNGNLSSAVKGYQRSFRKLFRIANIRNLDGTCKHCHSHMFRDTFAVELLLAGVPIDQVSALLGHRSIKMTEKHYLPWVKARQRQLTASVRRAWFLEVRQSPAPPVRESANIQTSVGPWAARCHSFELHVCVSPPVVHPFLLCL